MHCEWLFKISLRKIKKHSSFGTRVKCEITSPVHKPQESYDLHQIGPLHLSQPCPVFNSLVDIIYKPIQRIGDKQAKRRK